MYDLQILLWAGWTNAVMQTADPLLFVIHKLNYLDILSFYVLLDAFKFH